MPEPRTISPATGKLGVLLPGLGAVSSTFIAGVMTARRSGEAPIGSVSQMARVRLGSRAEGRNPLIRDFVPLASLDDLVFGGWDPISRERPRGGAHRGRSRGTRSGADQRRVGRHRRDGRGLRPALGLAPRRVPGEDRRQQDGAGRGADRRHRALPLRERLRPARDGVVRIDRGVPRAGRGAPEHRSVRAGPPRTATSRSARARSTRTPRCRATCPTPTAHRTSAATSRA